MSSLTGQQIKDTYQSLLKTDDNGLITTAFKGITDGSGSTSGLYLKNDGVLISGSLELDGNLIITGSINSTGGVRGLFFKNETSPTFTNIITSKENIFNHGDLSILASDIFIIEEKAEYYALGEVINSGSLIISGTLIVDGGIISLGPIILASGSGNIL